MARANFEQAISTPEADLDLQRRPSQCSAQYLPARRTALQSQDFQSAVELWKEAEAAFRSANEH